MKPSALRAALLGAAAVLAMLIVAPSAVLADTSNGLKIDWHRVDVTGLTKPFEIGGAVHANGIYLVGTWVGEGGRIWASTDARNWSVVWHGDGPPSAIVAGGPGFVAWQAGILLSTNGHHWTRANAGVPQKLLNADFVQLASVNGVVVAFPGHGHGYWSADGHTWHSISGGPEQLITMAGDETGLWAFTGGHNFNSGDRIPVQVWMTSNGRNWTKTAQLPHSTNALFLSAGFGPLGGVVIGGRRSWYSSDDIHWHVAMNTPSITTKGPDFVTDVAADVSGYVVAAYRDPPGCAIDPAQRRAITWTSVDGNTWRKMPSTGFLGKEIDRLFIDGRKLVGIGIDWKVPSEDGAGAVWRAPLPHIATDNAPPPPPVNPPGPQGC